MLWQPLEFASPGSPPHGPIWNSGHKHVMWSWYVLWKCPHVAWSYHCSLGSVWPALSLSPSSAGFTHADLDHEQWFACSYKSDWELHCEYPPPPLLHSRPSTHTLPTFHISQCVRRLVSDDPPLFPILHTGPLPKIHSELTPSLLSRWWQTAWSVSKEDLTRKQDWVCCCWRLCVPCSPPEAWRGERGVIWASGGDYRTVKAVCVERELTVVCSTVCVLETWPED